MGFLQDHWEHIQPTVDEGIDHAHRVAEGYIAPWNYDLANMQMIVFALRILRPRVVLELGTFEALGTKRLAETMSEYGGGRLYTFDAGEPVACVGRGAEDSEFIDWQNDPKYASWAKVKVAREERVHARYTDVEVRYIEGLTRDTLPLALPEIGEWDFCFQDSVHLPHLNIEEWEILKPYAKAGSVIVFDDIIAGHKFLEWFPQNNPEWEYRWTPIGRSQLWAEKRRELWNKI